MKQLEDSLINILKVSEKLLSDELLDLGEDYFEEVARNILENAHFEFQNKLQERIPSLINSKLSVEELSPILKARDIYDLSDFLENSDLKLENIKEYAASQDSDTFVWNPLFGAIRDHFTHERVIKLSSESEFKLALSGFLQLQEIDWDFLPEIEIVSLKPQLEALRDAQYATSEEKELLGKLISVELPESRVFTPPPIVFEGSSGGLEAEFLTWLEKHSGALNLFSDEDLEIDDEVDQNLESLKSLWLKLDFLEPSTFEGFVWMICDVNASIDLDLGDKSSFLIIHQLSQIVQDLTNVDFIKERETKNYFKLTLYRTGERHEYNSAMDRSLMALQCVIYHETSGVPLSNIEAEILWLRLEERDYPLVGFSDEEIFEISKLFMDSQ